MFLILCVVSGPDETDRPRDSISSEGADAITRTRPGEILLEGADARTVGNYISYKGNKGL